ncbi:TylF/MycF/NovP-related O-methyltransferase [Flavobacterium pokkalii]|nr:TylF/MycF/NovP-related O-methyltransferase [Flavobacterium pokkalii]
MSVLHGVRKCIVKFLAKSGNEGKNKNVMSSIKDFTIFEREVVGKVQENTMTSPERIVSLIHAVKYIDVNNIEGDIVECGVWRGGSIGTCILALNKINRRDKKIWLFDTFEGMNKPTEVDLDINGNLACERMDKENVETSWLWAKAEIDIVKENINRYNYPLQNINFIEGVVEKTLLLDNLPEKISLLRLDTDWYESTKIELEILYPKLVSGGILIIDDYGHWEGCKKAVDEFFEKLEFKPFLHRIDYTGRLIIKP